LKKSSYPQANEVKRLAPIPALGAKGWISGIGAPDNELTKAQNGFHYLDVDTSSVYVKEAGLWVLRGTLKADPAYAQEWANADEDVLVSADAGGDQVDDYSAKHHAIKASQDSTATAADAAATAQDKTDVAQIKLDVENIYDQFDDRYLGSFSTANEPTVDNDGNPLAVGAIYHNTTESDLRFWTGSVWDSPEASATASALAAANSAQSAADSFDSFDDIYLGAKASDPTVDNDGDPLQTGALYFRTTAPAGLKTYNGTVWVDASTGSLQVVNNLQEIEDAGAAAQTAARENLGQMTANNIAADAITNEKVLNSQLGAEKFQEGVAESDWIRGRMVDMTMGTVGTYVLASNANTGTGNIGSTWAANSLMRGADASGAAVGSLLSGTYVCCGYKNTGSGSSLVSLYMRIL
jgi:hypothetical protein